MLVYILSLFIPVHCQRRWTDARKNTSHALKRWSKNTDVAAKDLPQRHPQIKIPSSLKHSFNWKKHFVKRRCLLSVICMAIIMLLIAYYTCDEILKIWKYIVSNFLENRHFPFLTSNLKEKFRWHKKNNCNKNSIDIFWSTSRSWKFSESHWNVCCDGKLYNYRYEIPN